MTQNSPHANSFPEEWLSAYLDDELSAEQRQLVEAAIKEQPQLAQLLDELIATRRLIQQLPAFPTSCSRRSPSNTKSVVSDLDDGLDSLDDSSNSDNLSNASEQQLEQRLADDRPSMELARSSDTDGSSGLSWRMLTLAASLIGIAALGGTLWYQSDRWFNLAFDASTSDRVGSAISPEGLVDTDSGPRAFSSEENQVAPSAAQSIDPLVSPPAMTEGGVGGAPGSGSSGRVFAGGVGEGGLSRGALGGADFGTGGLGGGGLGGAVGNSPTNQPFDFTPRINDQQLSQAESFKQLHEEAKAFEIPKVTGERPDEVDPQDLLVGPFGIGGGNQFGAPSALESLNSSSPSVGTMSAGSTSAGELSSGAMSVEQMLVPQIPSASPIVASPRVASPNITSPAPSDVAMEQTAAPKQAAGSHGEPNTPSVLSDLTPPSVSPAPLGNTAPGNTASSNIALGNAVPGAPLPAESAPTDPAKPAPVVDPSPVASPKTMMEQPLNADRTIETLPTPAAPSTKALQGMKAKDGSRGTPEIGPAGNPDLLRGLDTENSATTEPSTAPSLTPPAAPLSKAQFSDATKDEVSKKTLPLKAQEKNQVLIQKSARYRSSAWSEADVSAQLDGNPLYRPMLSLLSDTKQDKSLKQQDDAKASQTDEAVLTAVVRLTANQRSAVIEQSKQLGIEPAIKDDGQTAWVLFLSATELDRLLESANRQEKLSIFWISPAKQSASSDRRVLIVNPF